MSLLINQDTLILWQDLIKNAESRSAITLPPKLEKYLISLLMRYTNKPELAQQIFAEAFLNAMQAQDRQRNLSLQQVGDQCLLYAGLFPAVAKKRQVKLSYFVGLGRNAYHAISETVHDIFWSLGLQFVVLMDVLQSIRDYPELLPLEAYEQWHELGSQRAFRILQSYTQGIPKKSP